MRSFVGIFLVSAAFGAAIAITYFFVAHEEGAGTALLGFMGAALTFAALYAVVAERDADLPGDYPYESSNLVDGEDLGIFTTETPYPILIAICALAILTGMLWSPLLGIAGLIGMLLCFWRLGAESARV
ncbi:MAG: cytochrome c oxidase subunit 4 [Candidatus Eremiobacteraeota bacterium]|nr:cytochrome c oxidase subunit 4 [Candidatus Eremiobacteraeota bacterium]